MKAKKKTQKAKNNVGRPNVSDPKKTFAIQVKQSVISTEIKRKILRHNISKGIENGTLLTNGGGYSGIIG